MYLCLSLLKKTLMFVPMSEGICHHKCRAGTPARAAFSAKHKQRVRRKNKTAASLKGQNCAYAGDKSYS